LNIWY